MSKELKRTISILILLVGLIGHSLAALAYIHSTFVSKDNLQYLVEDIRYIRARIDKLYKPK